MRDSKAEKLAMVARVLAADEILLCSSETGRWSQIDIVAVQAALSAQFADAPDAPAIRVITGLGGTDTEVMDYLAEPAGTTTRS
jgi:hypothetical protein